MKKGLFLLPLAGALLLSGCTFTLFGKTITLFEKSQESGGGSGSGSGGTGGGGGSGGGGSGGGGQPADTGKEVSTGGAASTTEVSSDAIVFDFTDVSLKEGNIFPYVKSDDAGALYEFTYQDINYNDIGSFVSTGYQGAPNYLMMKNKDYTGGDKYGTGGWSNKPAFIGNATPFDKPIKKVVVTINAGSSGSTLYRATIHTKAQVECATSGGYSAQGAGNTFYTETTSDEGYYFTLSTNKNSENKLYNGQISRLVISF